jgi:hypothetical protein
MAPGGYQGLARGASRRYAMDAALIRGSARDPSTSVLFDRAGEAARVDGSEEPAYFADLNLDQIVETIASGREEYRLEPFFYAPLRDVDAVRYRHEVFHDLARDPVMRSIRAFSEQMRSARQHLAQADKLHYPLQRRRWFLDAVWIYCRAVRSLADDLARLDPGSRGLRGIRDHLLRYVASDAFGSLDRETREVVETLADVRYGVHIKGSRVTVTRYEGEPDLSADVEETFLRFRKGPTKDYRVGFRNYVEMNHVEATVLDLVARLFPDVFRALDEHHARHQRFVDETIATFDREVQFYLAYLELIEPLRAGGLPFCFPRASVRSREVHATDAFDLALARTIPGGPGGVVRNDLSLEGTERILVVTGPNQGGKTTFARMFGQLHHLAGLGCLVPGTDARLALPDRVFAHFEREEDIRTLRGKLEDELVRIRDILRQATADSVVILNESFNSTTLSDATFLGREVIGKLIELGSLGVYVTFVDELASLSPATVSMVATVDPTDPAVRTHRIVRRPPDGLAYAAAIARKYGLTYASLKEQLAS